MTHDGKFSNGLNPMHQRYNHYENPYPGTERGRVPTREPWSRQSAGPSSMP